MTTEERDQHLINAYTQCVDAYKVLELVAKDQELDYTITTPCIICCHFLGTLCNVLHGIVTACCKEKVANWRTEEQL